MGSTKDSEPDLSVDPTYARWKGQSVIPFGFSFTGLAVLGAVGAVKSGGVWETRYGPVVLVFAALLLAGSVSLFLDIPRRRLSPFSQAFLGLGIAVLIGLVGIRLFNR